MATLTPQTADALNALLAAERASVECEIAFASGATEYLERQAFTTMGREDVEMCDALHERLASADAPVTPQVSPAGQAILALERYDERLRAFAEHQQAVSARAGELLREVFDGGVAQTLQRLSDLHVWHALWAERHADEFAATRLWENGRQPREAQGGGVGAGEAGANDPARGGTLTTMRSEQAGADRAGAEPPGSDGVGPTRARRRELGDSTDSSDGA